MLILKLLLNHIYLPDNLIFRNCFFGVSLSPNQNWNCPNNANVSPQNYPCNALNIAVYRVDTYLVIYVFFKAFRLP